MYKLIYRNKTNITFTINIPVPSSTVHFFLQSNFMTVWTRRGQWRVRGFVQALHSFYRRWTATSTRL